MTTPEQLTTFHRHFAAEANNRAWDLASIPDRTAGETAAMVTAAYAAAYHWAEVGTPHHHARAHITLAHALTCARQPTAALAHAEAAFYFFTTRGGEDWDIAFVHMELAFVSAALGETAQHAHHYALAQTLGAAIAEEDDRTAFLQELARIPRP